MADELRLSSTPSFNEFDPTVIPYQAEVIDDVKHHFDYAKGVHEVLLSGSIGSAKSILMTHLILRHCIEFPGSRVLIGRKALPDLKDTLYKKIVEHMEGTFQEKAHFTKSDNRGYIKFNNGSEIISRSWHDKNFLKFRSLELSMACIEELTENDDDDKQAYYEIRNRVGRLTHVPEHLMISATNPDAPSHWGYKHFILSDLFSRHVYYSITTDNPFLPSWYIDQLLEEMDEKTADRMIRGKWIELVKEVIYHSYSRENNYVDAGYEINPYYNIHICFDFNIAIGKPMSACAFQYIDDTFHIFDEFIVEGADTEQICSEIGHSGILDWDVPYIINGDAAGKARSSKSRRSDYDIIDKYFANYRTKDFSPLEYEIDVPSANPPLRDRHNRVNAYCKNALGKVRLKVYKKCKTVDEALRLTALKKGASYLEDDSKSFQHVGTALGYGICRVHASKNSKTGVRRYKIR